MDVPKVYISYSHDSEEFKKWVARFCSQFRFKGVDATIDQYEILLTSSIPEYMERGITDADYVIFLITKQFVKKYEERKGGIGYEINIATGEIFVKNLKRKFVPVLIKLNFDQVPPFLLGIKAVQISDLDNYNEQFLELYAYITGQDLIAKPPLGEIVPISDLKRELGNIDVNTIDVENYKLKTKTRHHLKWSLTVQDDYLSNLDFARIYNGLSKSFLRRKVEFDVRYFPLVFDPRYKRANSPSVVYESDNYTGNYSNWFMFERAAFENNRLHYNFLELQDDEKLFLMHVRIPLLSMWFILETYVSFHEANGLPMKLVTHLEVTTSIDASYDFQSSPFQLQFNGFERYDLKSHKSKLDHVFQLLNDGTLYDFFQKVLSLFVSENPRSYHPFLEIDSEDFKRIYTEIVAGRYSYDY